MWGKAWTGAGRGLYGESERADMDEAEHGESRAGAGIGFWFGTVAVRGRKKPSCRLRIFLQRESPAVYVYAKIALPDAYTRYLGRQKPGCASQRGVFIFNQPCPHSVSVLYYTAAMNPPH